MATLISSYLFNIAFCLASIYVDHSMQSVILGHISLFDTVLSVLTRAPRVLRALPSRLLRRFAAFYREGVANLIQEQKEIHKLEYEDALEYRKRYEKGLKLLGAVNPNIERAKSAEKELFLAVLDFVKTLRENVFLMDIIINRELEPSDQLEDLLEDYYDGLLVEQRKDEERFSWEQVKAELDAKHKFD
jgi:hypothetical protein